LELGTSAVDVVAVANLVKLVVKGSPGGVSTTAIVVAANDGASGILAFAAAYYRHSRPLLPFLGGGGFPLKCPHTDGHGTSQADIPLTAREFPNNQRSVRRQGYYSWVLSPEMFSKFFHGAANRSECWHGWISFSPSKRQDARLGGKHPSSTVPFPALTRDWSAPVMEHMT
jgi:hypothetical protein